MSPTQERAILGYLATTHYPARDQVLFLLSMKAGLRAKEMASLTWAMVTDASGQVAEVLHVPNRSRLWYHAYVSTSDRRFLQEARMAENEKEAYLALIAAHDPEIRTLLDQGFDFVTNAFKAGAAPSGMQARTDREHVRRLQQEGYQVEVTAAYDEQGQLRPSLSAIWRKKL